MELTPSQLNKLKKLSKFAEDKDLATVEEFDNLEQRVDDIKAKLDEQSSKLDEAVSTITEELKKKSTEELYEVDEDKIAENVLAKIPTPKDGEDYVLTENDKKEIAQSIKVPVVEKVVEIVREPTVTRTEVKVENPYTLEGEKVVDSINELPTDDDTLKIDASHIRNLPETVQKIGGGSTARNLWQLLDVRITNPQVGQSFKFNGELWINSTDDNTFTGSISTNQVAYGTGANTIGGSGSFVKDGNRFVNSVDGFTTTLVNTLNNTGFDLFQAPVVVGNLMYLVSTGSPNFRIYDISRPESAITLLGSINLSAYANSYVVQGNYAYIASNAGGFIIVDVSNPTSPSLVSTSSVSGSAFGIEVSGNLAYVVGTASSAPFLKIYNITVPATPVLLSTTTWTGTTMGTRVRVLGKYVYVVGKILKIIDASNPASPSVVGTYTPSGSASLDFLDFNGKYLIGAGISTTDNKLFIIDVSNPASPTLIASSNLSGASGGIFCLQNFVLVAGNLFTINYGSIFDISNPASPALQGAFGSDYPGDVYTDGRYLFVPSTNGLGAYSLKIYEISGFTFPTFDAEYVNIGNARINESLSVGGAISSSGGLKLQGNALANAFAKHNGLSTEFLKADGSVDSNTYVTTNYFDRVGTTVDFANHNDILDTTSDSEVYTISGTVTLSFHYEPDSSWFDDYFEYKVRVYGVKNGLYTQNYIESNSLYADIFDMMGVDLEINANEVFDSFAFLLYIDLGGGNWVLYPDSGYGGYYGIENITSTSYSQTYTGGVLDEGTDKLDATVTPNIAITNEYSLKTDFLKSYGIKFDNTYYPYSPITGNVNFQGNITTDGDVTTSGTTTAGTFVSDTYNFASYAFSAISYDASNGLAVGGGTPTGGGTSIGVDSQALNTGVAVGLGTVASGEESISIGRQVYVNGYQSVGIGAFAGGFHNYTVSVGGYSGYSSTLTESSKNVFIGWGTGAKVVGDNNIFLGYKAGYWYTTGATINNTFIVNSQDTTDSTHAILYGTMTNSPLTQTLDVNGTLKVATNLSPKANDGAALGTTSLMWSDLFLASGGVINFNNGDVTITHSANTLAFGGATTGYTFDAPVNISSSLQCDSIVNDTGLAHGTYTPTITNVTNVAASTAYVCHYARVGNQVWVFGKVDIDQTSAGAYEIGISLPIASNLTATTDLTGHATSINAIGISDAPYVEADTTNDRASFKGNDTDISNHAHHFHFMYTVI